MRGKNFIPNLIASRKASRAGVILGRNVKFFGRGIFTIADESSIHVGDDVVFISDSRYTALGVSHPVILRTLLPNSQIVIGAETGISGASICAASEVRIGRRCLIGADVVIADTDFHPINPLGRRTAPIPPSKIENRVNIGDDVFVGTRAVILKGSVIGDGSVVGAGAVVAGIFPPRSILVGNPARIVSTI